MSFRSVITTEIDNDLIASLSKFDSESLPCPSAEELKELSDLRCVQLRIIKVYSEDQLVAASICYVATATIHGFKVKSYRSFGDTLHDYTRLYAKDTDSLNFLMNEIRQDATHIGADVVSLDNQLDSDNLCNDHRRYITTTKTGLFDSEKEQGGWAQILNKKGIKKKLKKVTKHGGYQPFSAVGEYSPDDIEELAALHRERWMFAGIRSAFAQTQRVDEYLCHKTNKIITKVMLGDELLAVHYGMLYGDTLLFHTPVINVKYLEYSPLGVLLAEVSRFCHENDIRYIDFGLGDESYKEYFANSERSILDFLIPCSIKGYIVYLVRSYMYPASLKQLFLKCKTGLLNAYYRINSFKHKITWYEFNGIAPHFDSRHLFSCLGNYEEFVDFTRTHALNLEKYQYNRFKSGSKFVVLHDLTSVLSYGWIYSGDTFYISELDRTIFLQEKTILYDVRTSAAHGSSDHFTDLLRCMIGKFSNDTLAIFANPIDINCNMAITASGFRLKHTLTHWNYSLCND